MLYATAQTIGGGKRAGWMAALGIHVGGYAHVIAATFGLAVLFTAVPAIYLVLKFVGAAYLVWLGIQLFRSGLPAADSPEISIHRSPVKAFAESAMVEIFNPKTALFFLAFLPQFTDPSAILPIWAQLLILGTIVNVMFSSADIVCVMLSTKMMTVLSQSRRANKWAQRIGGSLLVGLGINLATSRQ
ncbi:MAG: LysE family translocator [Rhizobiaceae bacterium]|nr:LysE family translocator [Rhizobiaceae bacterium]